MVWIKNSGRSLLGKGDWSINTVEIWDLDINTKTERKSAFQQEKGISLIA